MNVQLSTELEQALRAVLESRNRLNERYIRYLDGMEAYWESQTPPRSRCPKVTAPSEPDGKPPKSHKMDIPASDMGALGELFWGQQAPVLPDDV